MSQRYNADQTHQLCYRGPTRDIVNGHNFCSLCWLPDNFDKHGDLEDLKTQHGTVCTDLQRVWVFPQELSQAPFLHISNLPHLRAFNFSTELCLTTQVSNYFFFCPGTHGPAGWQQGRWVWGWGGAWNYTANSVSSGLQLQGAIEEAGIF